MFFGSDYAGEAPRAEETVSQFEKAVIPSEPNDYGRDPESRKVGENQIILDPPPTSAGDDELRHSLRGEGDFEDAINH
jgi:hypothetical protein